MQLAAPSTVTALGNSGAGERPRQSPEALREAALAFESLFTKMMLQSMRATEFGDDLLGSGGGMYRDLFDQQVAEDMSKAGGLGLADLMIRQMTARAGGGAQTSEAGAVAWDAEALAASGRIAPRQDMGVAPTAAPGFASPQAFVDAIRPAAQQAADALGVPVRYVIAQAALESGWGAHMPAGSDGASSFNLFGIKAHGAGAGEHGSVNVATREFREGRWLTQMDDFRAYASPAASVADYTRFIQSNPRYADALNHGGDGAAYAQGLQAAGYATDPDYAAKLKRIAESPMLNDLLADAADAASPAGSANAADTANAVHNT